jgi:Major tropism determinant N-terminal domain
MSVQVQLRRDTAANIASAAAGAVGEVFVDTTNRRVLVNDGVTVGGVPANSATGPLGSFLQLNTLEGSIETITTGGTTYSSTLQIPARAMVIGVSHRVITAITGCTAFEIGVSGTPAMFATGLGTAAGSNNAGIGGPNNFYAATSLLLTSTAGGNFTGGTIRLSIQYLTVGPPAS